MPFDIDAARSAGYSDDEIVDFLRQRDDAPMDVAGALGAGYSPTEIVKELGSKSKVEMANRRKELGVMADVPAVDPEQQANQGVDINAGLGPMRQDYVNQTRSDLKQQPLAQQVAAAQGNDQKAKIAAEVAKANALRSRRIAAGNLLPQSPQEVADDAAVVTPPAPKQPEEPAGDTIGLAESMKRAVMEEVGQTGKYAGLALSAPVAVYAALHQAITGNEDQPLRDAAFKLLVDPSQRVIDANSIKPGERQNFAEKVVSGIGAFLVDLPMMLVSAQGAAPAKAATSINQYLGQALERGFIAMRPIMLKSAGEKVDQVIAHGGTVAEAINAGTTAALLTGATGAAPMSLEGTFLKRLATGMPVGAVISEINRQTQNIAMPDDLKTPFSAEGVAVGAVTGGILAGAAGHRAPEPAPTRTEQGYFTRTPMADAAHQLALDPARPAPTDVLHAQSIDEAIQTAKASLKPITVPTAEAPAVSPVVAQLKAIRPLPEPKVDPVARLAELEQAATDPNRVLSPDELTERDTLRMQDTVQKERDAAQTEIDKTVKGDPAASVDEAGATQYRGAPLVAVAKEALPDHSATEGNALSRQQAEVIDSLLRIGGQHLVIYDNHPNLPDGFVHPNSPDTVFLARNTSRAPEVVAIHEFNHIMERTAPEVHQAYLDTIREELKPGALAEARKQHGDLPEERLLREIGADIAGNAATSTKFMFRVVSKLRARFGDTAAQPMVKSLIDAVAGHLARVRELVKGGIFNKQGKATDVANAYVKDLEKVHNALADVYAEHFQQSHVEAGKAEAAKPEGIKAEVASIKQAKQQAATPAIASDAALPAAKQPQKKAPGQEPLLSAKREEKELPAPFYSQLSRSLDKAPPKLDNAPAVQWTAWINSNAAKMGVKADEIKWSGINEYLAMQGKNKLTRSQIQDYLKANGVQLKEVTKGEQAFEANERIDDARHAVSVANDLVDIAIHNALNHMRNAGASTEDVTQAYHAFLYNTPDRDSETLDKAYALLKKSAPAGYNLDTIKNAIADKNKAKEAYQEAVANVVPEPQYADFVLPGGRNYQELLLTLPEREPSFAIDDYIGQLDAKYGVKRVGQVSTSAWSVSDLTAAEQAKLKALQQATRAETERNRVFQSSHWEQPNVLAHIRFNERLDADGKRVLFVEELQSDWAAAGRKKGFRTPEFLQAEQALADFNEENKALVREKLVQRYMKKGLDQERAGRQADYELKTWSGYGYAEFLGRENEYMALQEPIKYQDTVPEGPFVTETKAWLALTIKRMIRYAAEHGYDRVAFVNGEQSADRYSLRKKVSRVTVKPFRAERGEYTLEAYDYADDVSFKKHMQLSDLDEYIGQELADKARQHVTEHGHADLKGVDLKVGGEGMKGFYDQIVPNVTREVLKKLGGGKLITSRIDTQGSGLQAKYEYIGPDYAPAVLTRSDMLARVDNAQLERQLREVARGLRGGQTFAEAMAEHGSISLAEKIGGKMVEKESVPNDQTAFDVTPAMREQALQGQPLFSPKRDQTETPEFKRWFGNSKVVDQSGKPLPMYHGTSKAGFDHFDTYASNYGLMGMGGYFTDNPQVASGYSKKAGGTAPGVYKTYLQIKNPLDMDAPADPDAWRAQFEDIDNYHEGGDTNEAWYRAAEQSLADQELPKWEGAEIMQNALRAMGHDGITHVGGGRVAADSVQHRVYIAFDPEQIKSATGNNGQFDPNNADIAQSPQRRPEREKVSIGISAATESIPGVKKLLEAARGGDTRAHRFLQDLAIEHMRDLLDGTDAKVQFKRATGVFDGEREPAVAMSILFEAKDKPHVLAALARFADNFNQHEIHVRQGTADQVGTAYTDGSYATPVYRWSLRRRLSADDIEQVRSESGLYGLTFGDNYVEAYYVGNPKDAAAIDHFAANAGRVYSLLGKNLREAELSNARLWPYGDSEGTIGYGTIRGELPTGDSARSKIAKLSAEYHTGQPVKGFDHAPVTVEQRQRQQRIARDFDALPVQDLDSPDVRRAYNELRHEVIQQYERLPIKVEVFEGQGEPYRNSDAMRQDVRLNNHLYIYKTQPDTFGPPGFDFTGHPLLDKTNLTDINGKPMLVNDLLRAVHDYYAHNLTATHFGPVGEEAAWKNHMDTITNPWARWALTTETRGQNSWVNFREGADRMTLPERGFAEQKAALLPLEYALTGDQKLDRPIRRLMNELPPERRMGSLRGRDMEALDGKTQDGRAARAEETSPARFSENRDDERGTPAVHRPDDSPGGLGRRAASRLGSYGTATKNAISVEGVHYSPVSQTILHSGRYGTGMPGAERERVMTAKDTRLRNRTFFYVNEGQGVFPEDGVGRQAHGVRLDNLYDAVADPLLINNKDKTLFESKVIDHGFDGYYQRGVFGRQGAVVLLGHHEVPVTKLHDGEVTAVAPKATLTPYRQLQDDLAKDKRLPGGEMKVAKIERLAPDLYQRLEKSGVLAHLAPNATYYASDIAAKIPPDGVQDSRPRINYTGPGAKIVNATQDAIGNLLDDALLKVSPMVLGSAPARALAKTFANADRLARWQWGKFDDVLRKNFTPDQRREMWEAADEENVLRQQEAADPQFIRPANAGLARLTPEQRQTMDTLQQYGEQLLQRARDVGMFDGDGLPYWTPRIAVMIDGSGDYVRMPGAGQQATSSGVGGNMTATSPNLKHRKYLLASDTEAAASALAQQRGGQGAELVRDIRTMPLAMARLERAIAGRELINQIKAMGQATGTVTANSIGGPGFFTLDHPAFTRFQPRFVEENGRTTPALDQNGDMVFDRVPIFISKEFEGPLKAVLSERSGTIYQGLMELKGKAMGLIMYSPMIHNAVEWGRALPVAPGKVMTFRIYFEGNRFKNDPSKMAQAISDGMVPIGGRGAMQDITGLMEQPELLPGRSLTAKLIGGALGLVHEGAGQAAKRGIDAAGDFWHNTLLWDRIGDLQAGLYNTVKTDLLAKGMDPTSAGALAAHFANRYAGALPNESMSAMTRKIANIVLFSRSFTLGNLGVMKDIVSGMPKDVQSQILMASGELGLKAAQGVARRKALGAFIIDVGLMYAANSLLQNAFQAMQDDSDLGDIGRGYAERFHALMQKVHEHPLQVLNSPVAALESLLPNSENEPGKQNRIDMGPDEHGTHIYLRLPIGKVGEEFVEWPTSPLAMLLKKQGTMVRPLLETIKNDKGFGEPVYDAEAHGFVGAAKNVGKIVANFMSEQVPLDSAVAVKDWAQGKANSVDKMKAVGPLVGLTFSKGAPGGPAVGEMYATARQHQAKLLAEMPEIRRLLKLGEQDAAIEKMMELNMSPGEIRSMLNHQENPESRLSSQAFKRFQRHADEEAKQRMERHLETR